MTSDRSSTAIAELGDKMSALFPTPAFRRELTPTWLSLACLLGGQRPPELGDGFRFVHLGCGSGITTAVVAAVHPTSRVWAWADRDEDLEATARLARAAGLDNLDVHERHGLPPDLGGPADIVVVDDVLPASEERRAEILAAVGASIRPGGLVCVTYRTIVGWAEIAPLQRALRRAAEGHNGHPDELVPSILRLVEQLRAGGARHLTERPAVAAWVEELLAADPAEVAAVVHDDLEPLSHAQVADALATVGCGFVGSVRLLDDLDTAVPAPLREMVTTAGSPALREAYRDLALRPTSRLDLFRRGPSELTPHEVMTAVGAIELVALGAPAGASDAPAGADELASADAATQIRDAVDAGRAHPAVVGGTSRKAVKASNRLAAALAELHVPLVPAPVIGSALPTDMDSVTLERAGAA